MGPGEDDVWDPPVSERSIGLVRGRGGFVDWGRGATSTSFTNPIIPAGVWVRWEGDGILRNPHRIGRSLFCWGW